jgi:hypothetical protein
MGRAVGSFFVHDLMVNSALQMIDWGDRRIRLFVD